MCPKNRWKSNGTSQVCNARWRKSGTIELPLQDLVQQASAITDEEILERVLEAAMPLSK